MPSSNIVGLCFMPRLIGVVVHKGRTVNQAKGGLGLASFRNLDTGLIHYRK